jgi:hypothetical protein
MVTKKLLPSERDTTTMKTKVLAAAHKHFKKRKGITAFFEHGHWWVRVDYYPKRDEIQTFDVVDAEGHGSIDGFGFEEVG